MPTIKLPRCPKCWTPFADSFGVQRHLLLPAKHGGHNMSLSDVDALLQRKDLMGGDPTPGHGPKCRCDYCSSRSWPGTLQPDGKCPVHGDRCIGHPKTLLWNMCPNCGSGPEDHEVRNYNMMWHDGDVYCTICGTYVRMWDAG